MSDIKIGDKFLVVSYSGSKPHHYIGEKAVVEVDDDIVILDGFYSFSNNLYGGALHSIYGEEVQAFKPSEKRKEWAESLNQRIFLINSINNSLRIIHRHSNDTKLMVSPMDFLFSVNSLMEMISDECSEQYERIDDPYEWSDNE